MTSCEESSQLDVMKGGEEHQNYLSTPQSAESSLRRVNTAGDYITLEDTYEGSEPPRNFRLLSDIYNEIEEI